MEMILKASRGHCRHAWGSKGGGGWGRGFGALKLPPTKPENLQHVLVSNSDSKGPEKHKGAEETEAP